MTDSEHKYWAFLSYSHEDNREQRTEAQETACRCWGDWLHDALKTFAIPSEFVGQVNGRGEIIPDRIEPIFRDELEPSPDGNLSADTRRALEQSVCLVVICSPRAARSPQVNEAVRYFKQLGRGKHILPIVVAGEPNASEGSQPERSPEDECFVPALRHPVKPDGTLDTTRRAGKFIFVDARHGDGKREIPAKADRNAEAELEVAKIQLIALLIGVGFHGLWWREQKRHFFDLAEAQRQTREALNQMEEVRRQARAAQEKALELQNLPRDVHGQIQEAQNQAREAQAQAHEAQKQLQEFQNKIQETQTRLEEAGSRALSAESRLLEAQQQTREAQGKVEEARTQARDAEAKVRELQTVRQDVASDVTHRVQEAQNRVSEAQKQAQEAQSQLEEARKHAEDGQGKILAAQHQVQEFQGQARSAQSQLEEVRTQFQQAQRDISEAQNQAREALAKVAEIENQTREARSHIAEAQSQAKTAQTQVREIQKKKQAAERLAKVLALLAVLAALAASIAWWQRTISTRTLVESTMTRAPEPEILSREQIRQTLQKDSGPGQDEKRIRSLDVLAGQIPAGEFSNTLVSAAAILDGPQRSYFQEQLLGYWMQTNWPAAFDWSCQLTNADDQQRALEKIVPASPADTLTNTFARLNDLKPAPGEPVYTLLFQRWATEDPVQAIGQRQQIPGHDADGQVLSAILEVWAEQQPAAALNWLESEPDSEALPAGTWRNLMIAGLFDDWAAKDLEAATTACQQLPDGPAKELAWEYVLNQRIEAAPASAAIYVTNLPAGDYRQKAIVELCNHWVDTNATAVLDWAQFLSSYDERVAMTNQVIVNWAHKDPPAAAQYASQHPELSAATFGDIASTWFQGDLNATTNWIATLPDGEKKDAGLLALVEPWAQRDTKGLVAYALGLAAGDVQTRYLTTGCGLLAAHDLSATVELLQPLADDGLRQSILEQAAHNCGLPHMNQAAKYIAAMPAGDDQKAAMKGLLSNWTATDPESAVNWLCTFPETNAQPEQAQAAIRTWSQSEPAAVAKWLTNAPAGTNSDGMVGAFLEGAVEKYPLFAWQWTQAVTDDAKRKQYQQQVGEQWMKADPMAAGKWVKGMEGR